ncbi:MAG TPA: 4-hydroxy-tetrahydrodipicolinate synthase [Miltoncostaeaceae bacterium]|nr:4-hydroxy-tetrahydrodipicolinate synthase [Miltoncostaeaceae bacterium]
MLGTILTAMVTPFADDLRIDEPAAARLAHHLVEHGSDGLVIAGTTGEASTLNDEEQVALVRLAVREVGGGRSTVVAGTGTNDTAHSVHLTRLCAEAGADAALVVTPYYNRPPREGIVAHIAAIAEVGLPVVLYNIPVRTALNMPPDLIAELAGIPGVVALKQANPDPGELRAVAETPLALYAGNDDMLLEVVELGGAGVISVSSHLVGEEMGAVAEDVRRGDLDEARRRDAGLADLYAGLFVTTSPILIKAALEMTGLIPSGRLRLPLVEATPVQRDILRTVLERRGILSRA